MTFPKAATVDVESIYRIWAPIYNYTFGRALQNTVKKVIDHVNATSCSGQLLEIGIGTGLSLAYHNHKFNITGIDLSGHMLARADRYVRENYLSDRVTLMKMDAARLDFPAEYFDAVVMISVVNIANNPGAIIREADRVCKTGGFVYVSNHFAGQRGRLYNLFERLTGASIFSRKVGLNTNFYIENLELHKTRLKISEIVSFGPATLVKLQKTDFNF